MYENTNTKYYVYSSHFNAIFIHVSHTLSLKMRLNTLVCVLTAIYFNTFTNNSTNALLCEPGVTLQRLL